MRNLTRSCLNNGKIAEGCEGISVREEPCYKECSDSGWSEWSEWSVCSSQENTKHRSRKCISKNCSGPEIEFVQCEDTNEISKQNIFTQLEVIFTSLL